MCHINRIGNALLLSFTLLAASGAHAATLIYDFGDLLSGKEIPGAPGSVAQLTVDTTAWTFRLEALQDLNVFGDGAYIRALAVDGDGKKMKVAGVAAGSGVDAVKLNNGNVPGDPFDFRNVFGQGKDRLSAGEYVEWSLTGLVDFNGAAIQLLGLGDKGKDSAWYGLTERAAAAPVAAVPLPPTAWLLAPVMAALAAMARRRRRAV